MDILPTTQDINDFTNKIWHCQAEELLAALPSDSVDMILTSPPYDNLRTYKGFSWDFESIAQQSYRVLKQGGVLVWVVGDATVNGSETLTSFRQALYFVDVCGFRMHDTMIWEKDATPFPSIVRYRQQSEYMFVLSKESPTTCNLLLEPTKNKEANAASFRQSDGSLNKKTIELNDKKPLSNIWAINVGFMKTTLDTEAYAHPAIFPEELARRHIHTWSNTGDIVLDYFSGSGTTAKIARNLDRQYIACDISLEYCELARTRLANTDPYQNSILKTGEKQLSLFASLDDNSK